MSSAQIGSSRSVGGGSAKWVFAVIVAVVIAIVAAYFVLAGGAPRYGPNATGAPGTYAPVPTNVPVPSVPRYP